MPNYKKMYFKLFNGISDAIEALQKLQIEVEEMYISDESEDDDNNDCKPKEGPQGCALD